MMRSFCAGSVSLFGFQFREAALLDQRLAPGGGEHARGPDVQHQLRAHEVVRAVPDAHLEARSRTPPGTPGARRGHATLPLRRPPSDLQPDEQPVPRGWAALHFFARGIGSEGRCSCSRSRTPSASRPPHAACWTRKSWTLRKCLPPSTPGGLTASMTSIPLNTRRGQARSGIARPCPMQPKSATRSLARCTCSRVRSNGRLTRSPRTQRC